MTIWFNSTLFYVLALLIYRFCYTYADVQGSYLVKTLKKNQNNLDLK